MRATIVRSSSAKIGNAERNGSRGIANFVRAEREDRLASNSASNNASVDRRDSSAGADHLARAVARTRTSKTRPAPVSRHGLAVRARASARSPGNRGSSGRASTGVHGLRAAEVASTANGASLLPRVVNGPISDGARGRILSEVSGRILSQVGDRISNEMSDQAGRAAPVQNHASMASAARDSQRAQSLAVSREASASFAARADPAASLAATGPARSAADGSAIKRGSSQ